MLSLDQQIEKWKKVERESTSAVERYQAREIIKVLEERKQQEEILPEEEEEELEEVSEPLTMWRYTISIMYAEHHNYYSIVAQAWGLNPDDLEDRAKKALDEEMNDRIGYDLNEYPAWQTEGTALEEVEYDQKLIDWSEARTEFRTRVKRHESWKPAWHEWERLKQSKLSDLV